MASIAFAVRLCTASMVLVGSVAFPARVTAQESATTDRAALAAMYDATGGPAWTHSTRWKTPAPLGEWHGVTTDAEGRVTGLHLPDNGLAGRLPARLGRLGRLRVLSLRGNELTGPVPPWLGRLPRLRSIDIGSNALTGPIPAALERLGSLEYLSLGENELTGLVPAWLGSLVELRLLDLGENELTGTIPSSLERLRDLERLSLGGNRLTGPIPTWLGRLPDLRALDLGGNGLTGPIPAGLGDLTHLEWLDLDRNELVGAIPDTLKYLGELEHLSLGGNDLVGPFPTWLGDLRRLAWLDLDGNALFGSLPGGLRHLTALEHLSLRGNELHGPAPPWLGELVNLRVLDLGGNALSGTLPPMFGHLPHLAALHVDGTSLVGPLPQELTRPPKLSLVAFHDSALCAPSDVVFQDWLATLQEWSGAACSPWQLPNGTETPAVAAAGDRVPVHVTDLFRTWLEGRYRVPAGGDGATGRPGVSGDDVPSGRADRSAVPSAPRARANPDSGHPMAGSAIDATLGPRSDRAALVALYDATGGPSWRKSTNWKTGKPLGEWHGVSTNAAGRVRRLSLKNNRLTGRIPPALGRLTSLRELNLRWNTLTGRIPSALGRLTNLEWLLLDGNTLTGGIPPALGRLTNLEWLWLAGNLLTGGIPPALSRLTNLESLDLLGNTLTGGIPQDLGRLTNLEDLRLGHNTLTGRIPRELGRLTNLESLDLGGNPLTGRIPPELGRLTNLRTLFLYDTLLTGRIPPDLGRLTNLEWLWLGSWGLTGALPAGLRRAPLEDLALLGSQTCAPTSWREWVKTIDFHGALCGARSDVTIDVLVVYTPAVSRLLGDADAVAVSIDLLIAATNTAFKASGVRPRVALVGRSEVLYTETGNSRVDLERLADSSDGHMDRVHAIRRRTGADIVHLLVAESDWGGRAQVGGDFGVSVAGADPALFVHELGHNMGLDHDHYELELRDLRSFSPGHGYVNQRAFEAGSPASSHWVTIMAYADQCDDAGLTCITVLRFSNPRQRLRGDRLGVPFRSSYPRGVTGPSDAVAWLNRAGPAVAARRNR